MNEKIAVCPGSFDPITFGHIDVVERSSKIFDKVIVAILQNTSKESLFTIDERVDLASEALKHIKNVEVKTFSGLLVDAMQEWNSRVAIKGLRAVSDFEYELQMAQMNNKIDGVETFFIATSPKNSFLSSSLVKEVARFNKPVHQLVSENVVKALKEKFS